MGNSRVVRCNRRHGDTWYWDRLPKQLREELSMGAYRWDSKWFYDRWESGKWSIPALVREARQWDLREAAEPVKWRRGFKWHKEPSSYKATKVKPLWK